MASLDITGEQLVKIYQLERQVENLGLALAQAIDKHNELVRKIEAMDNDTL